MSVSFSPDLSPDSFTHLHVHSLYSDGLAHPAQLVQKAAALGYSSLALTDHNTLDGHPAFILACQQFHLSPILGVELKVWDDECHGHLLILTSNPEEYDRLRFLTRRKHIKIQDVKGCGYVTTACLGGHIAQWLLRGDYPLARDTLCRFADLFGDRLFVEIQPTFGTVLPWLLALARDVCIPAIVTNDVHVVEPGYIHNERLGLYLFSAQQMHQSAWYPGYREGCLNAAQLARVLTWKGT